jgi:hypothetical protein
MHEQLMKFEFSRRLKPAHQPELEATTHIFTQSR